MSAPHFQIAIDGWLGAAAAFGFLLPSIIAAAAGGYILGGFVLRHVGRTVLGTHVRHFFARIAPAKLFHISDREVIERIIRDGVRSGRLDLEDLIRG